jgi:hypothetical protein
MTIPWIQEKEKNPRVEITAQGRLLHVRAIGLDVEMPHGRGRGDVTRFTKQSRVRLLRLLARMSPPPIDGYRARVTFLTLTARAYYHPREFKRLMTVFFKRLGRKAPKLAIVWRLEYQKRGAPHVHCIVYNAPYIDKTWIRDAWGQIIGQDAPFTRIEMIKSHRHLMSYASKYAAKLEVCGFNSVTYLTDGVGFEKYRGMSPGRVWGVFNRKFLPYAQELHASVPIDASWWMLRTYCSWSYPWVWAGGEGGFTVFTDDPYHALKHMVEMSEYFINLKA